LEAAAVTALQISCGDLMASAYLIKEFRQDIPAALRFCEENCVPETIVLLLREAEKRQTRHMVLPRRSRDGHTP
jgi:hypothetical protein